MNALLKEDLLNIIQHSHSKYHTQSGVHSTKLMNPHLNFKWESVWILYLRSWPKLSQFFHLINWVRIHSDDFNSFLKMSYLIKLHKVPNSIELKDLKTQFTHEINIFAFSLQFPISTNLYFIKLNFTSCFNNVKTVHKH